MHQTFHPSCSRGLCEWAVFVAADRKGLPRRNDFFHDAEMQVRNMSTPPSLSTAHGQYVDAMTLYASAAAEMLKFTASPEEV